jgi:MFS family permease
MSDQRRRVITVALMLSNVMSGLDNTIINTALPRIIADLHGIEYTGWLVAIFLLGTAVSTPLWSKLGERRGNKLAYQLAAACFLLGALLQGCAQQMSFLLTFRLLAGIGNGGMVSLPYIIYSDLYPNAHKRLKVLGMVSAFFTTATILGPLFGGWIVDALSWRWVFYINIPVALISIVLIQIFFLDEKKTGQLTGST